MPSPRVLDASLNRLERLPPSLPPSLQRLVLSSNRLTSLAGMEQLRNLKVRRKGACGCESVCRSAAGLWHWSGDPYVLADLLLPLFPSLCCTTAPLHAGACA